MQNVVVRLVQRGVQSLAGTVQLPAGREAQASNRGWVRARAVLQAAGQGDECFIPRELSGIPRQSRAAFKYKQSCKASQGKRALIRS